MPGWRIRKNPRVRKWRNDLAASAALQWDSSRRWIIVTYCDKGPKFGLCTTYFCTSWLRFICLFFNSILHACLAANMKLSSTPSGLISIKQFVIWVSFAAHDKLWQELSEGLHLVLLHTQMIFYPSPSKWAFWESALFFSVPNARSSTNFSWISGDLKGTRSKSSTICSAETEFHTSVTPRICNNTGLS